MIRRRMRGTWLAQLSKFLGFFALVGFLPAQAAAAPLKYVFLVQNSGWMEPFYSDDRAAKFDAAVAAFIERAAPTSAPIVIASFNRAGEIEGRGSPFVVYDGLAAPGPIATAVSRVDLPKRADGRLANSDYREALLGAINQILRTSPGVIFMITNNKSAPDGREQPEDGLVTERTEAFNEFLKVSDAIPRIVAWPLRFPARGRLFQQRGLVIYGIAYGSDASLSLKLISESAGIRQLLTDPPVRLKPLSFDPLTLMLKPGSRGDLTWYADSRGGVMIDGISGGGDIVSMNGALTNTHYPYVIEHAVLRARWAPAGGVPVTTSVTVRPTEIARLAPFSTIDGIAIDLSLSRVGKTGWFTDRIGIRGKLSIELLDLKLGLAPGYARKMSELFGTGAAPRPDVPVELPAQVPKIFFGYRSVDRAVTEVPMTLIVTFVPWGLIGAIGLAVPALAAMLCAVWFLSRERVFQIPIDGETRAVALRPFQSKEVHSIGGTRIVTRGGFGPPIVKPKSVKI